MTPVITAMMVKKNTFSLNFPLPAAWPSGLDFAKRKEKKIAAIKRPPAKNKRHIGMSSGIPPIKQETVVPRIRQRDPLIGCASAKPTLCTTKTLDELVTAEKKPPRRVSSTLSGSLANMLRIASIRADPSRTKPSPKIKTRAALVGTW